MPEILITPISLSGSAAATSKAARISYATTGGLESSSLVAGRFTLMISADGLYNAQATATTLAKGLVKHIKSVPTGKATTTTKSHKFKTIKSNLMIESKLDVYLYDRDIRESMLDSLPVIYQDIKEMRSLIVSEANEFTMLYAKLDELFMQFFVDTATYSLDDWATKTNAKIGVSGVLEVSRGVVKQRLTGLGTITPEVLKGVVDSFYTSEMTELPTPGVIRFRIVGKRGQPDNFNEIRSAANEFIPTHLKPEFIFSYLTWGEIEAAKLTWGQAEEYTFKELEETFLL